ncbi:methionine ABC transporter ATP-binding protein [Actinoplanes sp. SE50]|uniref:methionine ABC transporter ATP-binding protein n=1 Tax=unclassified Actinoplanes TaxID=2626549 RepID=UPI00023ED62C|nr:MULTISPECIES: methionine ABC transporter ATP-binding protein [unclassified Actinoplanes]AEV85642.1 Methionine import ATP-binding protein metN [Actinoplanes sp. SE50/110]ATO84035.1 methionine ABC transporter ATP-binding protein [Actinoplanes sp. SE50]SLM01445.1 methionine ABC transporter ATP-binding protein [Actinoplanes sp. SE50/110]
MTKTFTRGRRGPRVAALDDVSLEVAKGEVFGVIGHSGAGKSTLIRLINGLETPTSGQVWVGDHDIAALSEKDRRGVRREIGMIFQQFNLFRSRTVAGNVAYPLKVAGVEKAERDRRVARLLDFVGLLDRAHDHPEQLSGGQKQRVGIARALATDPALLLADEATSALDPKTTAEVLDLLRRVNKELGVTIVLITHEMDVIRAVADRVAVMDAGRIAESGPVYDVFAEPASTTAADFVHDALRDRPSERTLERLRRTHRGRIVTVAVRDRTALSRVFLDRQVAAELIFGGISELQERAVGSLTFELTGSADGIDGALADLRAAGVSVEEH